MSKPESCWTCRLRRKKCGREQPTCRPCAELSIACHYSKDRPRWMDGGEKQEEMAQRIKIEVKQGAETRRDRQYVQVLNLRGAPNKKASGQPAQATASAEPPQVMEMCQDCLASETYRPERYKARAGAWTEFGGKLPPSDELSDCEIDFTMMFLDYVFPFLFPFYRPRLLNGGRSWLLGLLRDNSTLFHAAMSLSSWFFTLILSSVDASRHHVCRQYVWKKLGSHTDTALKSMRGEMQRLTGAETRSTVLQRARVMGSITQLMVFEVAMAKTDSVEMHLTAAITLFNEIFEDSKIDGRPDLKKVNVALENPGWEAAMGDRLVYSPDQASFRFFLAVLLWSDVISCTSLKRPPQLQNYHKYLIFDQNAGNTSESLIRTEQYVGCPGWVLLAIAQTAKLAAWKAQSQKNGSSVQEELTECGSGIYDALRASLERLEANKVKTVPSCFQDLLRKATRTEDAREITEQAAVARIWSHAACIYITVVTIGWQPQSPAICNSVNEVLSSFREVLSPAALRSLAWPFCVAGCLAGADREKDFRDMAAASGTLQAFGTVGQALQIMEAIWERRNNLGIDWDLASCFRVLGLPVLLL